MHNHWKTIRSLGNELKELIVGYAICNCYSKSKDELYLEFENAEEVLGLKSIFHPKGIFFTKDISKYKSSKDQKQFTESMNETVIDVKTYPYERCFLIELTSQKSILFKCFGVHANVIYFEDHKPVKIFRQSLLNDLNFDLDKLNHSTEKNIEVPLKNESYQLMTSDNKYDIYANKELYKSYKSVYDALHDFSKLYLSKVNFDTLKNQLQLSYQNQLNKLKYKLDQVKIKQQKLSAERPKDEIANIIMANIHQYNGSEDWKLVDFYTNENIVVHLKRNQTPTQLATQLYQKHKNKNIETVFIKKQLDEIEKNIVHTEHILNTISSAKHISEIEKYKKDKAEPETASSLFKSFKIDGWEIYVGKNAKNNEEL
ncbi:MAG: NFACT family protein, partial [Bacteroidetes bacterium]|nr:NFACT family protein [Bacteroidota bacterium]